MRFAADDSGLSTAASAVTSTAAAAAVGWSTRRRAFINLQRPINTNHFCNSVTPALLLSIVLLLLLSLSLFAVCFLVYLLFSYSATNVK